MNLGAASMDTRRRIAETAAGVSLEPDLGLRGDGPVELLVRVLEVLLDRLQPLLAGAAIDHP